MEIRIRVVRDDAEEAVREGGDDEATWASRLRRAAACLLGTLDGILGGADGAAAATAVLIPAGADTAWEAVLGH